MEAGGKIRSPLIFPCKKSGSKWRTAQVAGVLNHGGRWGLGAEHPPEWNSRVGGLGDEGGMTHHGWDLVP